MQRSADYHKITRDFAYYQLEQPQHIFHASYALLRLQKHILPRPYIYAHTPLLIFATIFRADIGRVADDAFTTFSPILRNDARRAPMKCAYFARR